MTTTNPAKLPDSSFFLAAVRSFSHKQMKQAGY